MTGEAPSIEIAEGPVLCVRTSIVRKGNTGEVLDFRREERHPEN